MCECPIKIKNPNYGAKHLAQITNRDITSTYIYVPCGKCKECQSMRQMGIVQRIIMETKTRIPYYCTLTYNNEMLPTLTTSTGYTFKYANIKHIQDMIKRLRRHQAFNGRNFKYLAVSELGSTKGRPHFHIIFLVEKYEKDTYKDWCNIETIGFNEVLKEWTVNEGSTRKPKYKNCCTFKRVWKNGILNTNYDFHLIRSINGKTGTEDVGFYVTKYILKNIDDNREVKLQKALKLNLPDEEYKETWQTLKTKIVKSLDFGDSKNEEVIQQLRKWLKEDSRQGIEFPTFYNENGKGIPLAKFYKKKGSILDAGTTMRFFYNSHEKGEDGFYQLKEKTLQQIQERKRKNKELYEKLKNRTDNTELFNPYEEQEKQMEINNVTEELDKHIFDNERNFDNLIFENLQN